MKSYPIIFLSSTDADPEEVFWFLAFTDNLDCVSFLKQMIKS